MDDLIDLYRRNQRHQRGITVLAAGLGVVLALAPHHERAIFIIDSLPGAFAAVPLDDTLEGPSVMITAGGPGGIGGPFIGPPLDRRFLRAVGGAPAAPAAPGALLGPAGGGSGIGPDPVGAAPGAPFGATPAAPVQFAGLGPGGPFVGSPLGPGFSSSPVGPATGATPDPVPPVVVDPTTPGTPTPPVTPPVTPTDPGTPGTPTPPVTPVDPTPPVTPVTPTDPTAPVDPTQPPIIPAVPEPLTWLLMIVGFFGCGMMLRRDRSAQLQAIAPKGD